MHNSNRQPEELKQDKGEAGSLFVCVKGLENFYQNFRVNLTSKSSTIPHQNALY